MFAALAANTEVILSTSGYKSNGQGFSVYGEICRDSGSGHEVLLTVWVDFGFSHFGETAVYFDLLFIGHSPYNETNENRRFGPIKARL
jgi:hypothetical protein